MIIVPTKSLVKEIAPGVITLGRNPFEPVFKVDEGKGSVTVQENEVLTAKALVNISGDSLNYKDALFLNRPHVNDKKVLIEGDIDLSSINFKVANIESKLIEIEENLEAARKKAKKWALVLG
jgi:hypothetical protein